MSSGYYYNDVNFQHPFALVFRFSGTVWPRVLPYCLLNCVILTALNLVKLYFHVRISILPQGHALMSLLIAYLGVSKVNLAYDRYMTAQTSVGHAFMLLRELNQLALTLTEKNHSVEAVEWRRDTKLSIIQLIHETVATLRDGRHAAKLARNVGFRRLPTKSEKELDAGSDDPMVLVHALRSHLFHDSLTIHENTHFPELQLLERCKMIDILHEFAACYRSLLRLASTPLPFALVQMGRTFIFIWTLTIPLVLSGKDFIQEYASAYSFVILLTYGFLGLEFVSMMLSNPFGDEIKNDLNVRGMGIAAIVGVEQDSKRWKEGIEFNSTDADDKSVNSTAPKNLRDFVQERQESIRSAGRQVSLSNDKNTMDDYGLKYSALTDKDHVSSGFFPHATHSMI